MQDVPGYMEAIAREDYEEAYRINRRDNVLPGILGRICHRPCEPACRHGRAGLGESVQICFLKRSAADFGLHPVEPTITSNGKSVCIVGSGPAGLTAANDLALRGCAVTLLEQFDKPGGMLRHSIPAFRLPVDVVKKDIQSIIDLGVTVHTNVRIESREQVEDLQVTHDAVIFATGCMVPSRLELAGQLDIEGFYWGLDFMMQSAQGELDIHPKNAVIIGGSYVAVDCARTCFRSGADQVTMAYRRTRDYLRAGAMELEALDEEGVTLEFMTSPVEILSEGGKVTGVKMIRNEIDADGLAQPVSGSEFTITADMVILAIGQEGERYDLEHPATGTPSWLYHAGDFKHGAGTVVEACADGRAVAREVHQDLTGVQVDDGIEIEEVDLESMPRAVAYDGRAAAEMPTLPVKKRRPGESEVELGYSREQATAEAHRCYLCQYRFQIDESHCMFCGLCIEFAPVGCISLLKDPAPSPDGPEGGEPWRHLETAAGIVIDQDACIRCGECAKVCPTGCISVSKWQGHRDPTST